MFYDIITKKRDQWLSQTDCVALPLISYIETKGKMRDAQIDAIKTYLYLKIECQNLPLAELFKQGRFNTLTLKDIDNIPLSTEARKVFKKSPTAVALYEFASQKDENGDFIAEDLRKTVMAEPQNIDFDGIFNRIFYSVNYPDYVFSLPMGTGKTFLMAAFIYLDLYFAQQEPDNTAFAHNFMVLVPSGLKTSVIPSLRTIQDFDPSWVIPEPAASGLKRELKFEMLDENRSANKSNRTKNPNVQKIAIHEPLAELFGLVAVTNAEKVILDRIDTGTDGLFDFHDESVDEKDRVANELRNKIGKLPHLSILIDEVHHVASSATDDEAKLRTVVNRWTSQGTITTVLGFSGTPYLDARDKIAVIAEQSVATTEMSNITNYYPLAEGIGNFLKVPKVVKSDSDDRAEIVEKGVREFLHLYKDTIYTNGTCAKLGIYCGTIETLETVIYPLVNQICADEGIDPAEAVLKFHEGNKQYPAPQTARAEFAMLDRPQSRKRIVLLVQIGKEGWDCKSLTGIILSQEGDCKPKMVLQTSCRCLREVTDASKETALIYLNSENYKYLDEQLQKQQHISIQEFQQGKKHEGIVQLNRYDRTAHLHLPKVEFYQMRVTSTGVIEEPVTEETTSKEISHATDSAHVDNPVVTEWQITNRGLQRTSTIADSGEHGSEEANYNQWLYRIAKESFGNLSIAQLNRQSDALQAIFDLITYTDAESVTRFSSHYSIAKVNANIRKAFYEKRILSIQQDLIDTDASLLHINADTIFSPIEVLKSEVEDYIPQDDKVENIVKEDRGEVLVDEKTQAIIDGLMAMGQTEMAEQLRAKFTSEPNKDRSYHYLPYHVDSRFESVFLNEVLTQECIHKHDLEVYYNGDGQFTEFRIDCFKKNAHDQWKYIGRYTPDFLIVKRQGDKIHKVLIVETKGALYAQDEAFRDRRAFVEGQFLKQNEEKFGYRRFDYLYLEDTLTESERINKTNDIINQFFV
ncbi:MAG: DEAD/DEAH box helicase family protein [Prevotella sp.]|nr:DEAD/DEAH box helicase family protein [Candidatus Equicola faecalis]